MNLVEGARCSETVNGTNGVGTALAADHPVQVFAFEHFSHHHREWVCSGAPIHDRVSGRLVGVIDLSSPWRIAHPRSLELVTTAARTTEQCLLEGRRDHDARLRRRYGDLTTKSTRSAREPRGLRAYRRRLGAPKATRHSRERWRDRHGRRIARRGGAAGSGRGLSRPPAGPRRARAAQGEALERAEGRARELARKRAAPSRARDPGRAGEVESGLPSPGAGERLSAYLEAAIDCVIVADASGRIVEFNPAAERTFGYSRKEALGRTMAELIVPPSLRERHIAAFARFVKTREGSMLGRRVELTGMRADGSEFPVELALSQVEAEPVLICGALRDISATKQAESHLRELAEEQAALRQVATLVAYESSPERLVAVVVEQVARVFDVPLVRLIRYEPTAAVVVGGFSESDDEPFPIGSRWQLDTPGLLATIRHTGRAARVEDYAQAPGDGAGAVRAAGMRSAVGSPIVVGGGVWGAIVLLSPRSASLPEDTGARLADFTDLVATALANAESRAALSQLADEQAALRRVATIVARAPRRNSSSPRSLERWRVSWTCGRRIVTRYDPTERLTLGEAFRPDLARSSSSASGTCHDWRENVVTAQVFDTHGPRESMTSRGPGTVGSWRVRRGSVPVCAVQSSSTGRLWGKMCVFSRQERYFPRERRIASTSSSSSSPRRSRTTRRATELVERSRRSRRRCAASPRSSLTVRRPTRSSTLYESKSSKCSESRTRSSCASTPTTARRCSQRPVNTSGLSAHGGV